MTRILIKKITPKRQFDFKFFEEEFRSELQNFGKSPVKTDLQGTTQGWREKPGFTSRVTITPDTIAVDVFPTGPNAEKYNLVVRGSPPHIITPKNPQGTLAFRTGYIPATRPGSLSSKAARFAGRRQPKFAKVVRHPGFKGREFYKLVADKNIFEFRRISENAIRRAAARLNASMR